MTKTEIARQRLYHQCISRTAFTNPEDVVAWFGAVQAQDYLGALWAVGLRCRNATEATVEDALNRGAIIRTWPMRGTLHFIAPADARWMLQLLTPRIIQQHKARLERDYELNPAVYARSRTTVIRALEGGRRLTRNALYQALENARIAAGEQRGLHIVGQHAQEGLICFGPREGKQQTFVLLEEWIPPVKPLERDEALGRLALRYFNSHGPATVQDFAWWSGLTTTDASAGLEMARSQLNHESIDGRSYWFSAAVPTKKTEAFLLPVYDEYTVAYKDRSAVIDPNYAAQSNHGIFSPVLVIDGQIAGTWKRMFSNSAVTIEIRPFDELNEAQTRETTRAAERFGDFL